MHATLQGLVVKSGEYAPQMTPDCYWWAVSALDLNLRPENVGQASR